MIYTKPRPPRLALADLITPLVVFVIFTNIAVLAVHFHGLPTIAAILPVALLLIPLAYHVLIRRQPIVMPPATLWLVLFMLVLMVSTLFARDVPAAFSELVTYLTEGLLLYMLLVNVIRTSTVLRLVLWALLAATIVLGGVPLYQQLTGTFDNNYGGLAQTTEASFRTGEASLQGDVRQVRLAGAIGEMNRFAQVMLMLLPLSLFRFFSEKSRLLRLLALLASALAAAGMALAFSRGAAVAFVLMIVLMVLLKVIRPVHLFGFAILAWLLIAAMPQYSQRLISIPSITALISGQSSGADSELDGAIRGRATVMMAAALVYADHPIVGVGPGMFRYYSREYSREIALRNITEDREAHSLYLGLAAESGTLGLFFFMIMLLVTFRDLLWVRKYSLLLSPDLNYIVTSFLLALIAYLTAGLFLHLSYMRFFWAMFALASAAGLVARQELRQAIPNLRAAQPMDVTQPAGVRTDWPVKRTL
jgi:putative inorganic carbon (hco3(-)) transporter